MTTMKKNLLCMLDLLPDHLVLSFCDHGFDLLIGQTTLLVLDSDRLGLAGALVGGGNFRETVGIDFEGDLDLRDTARRRRKTGELDLPRRLLSLVS